MAVTTKTVSTLNVILQDAMNGDTTFKLDDPKDGITYNDVKGVFDTIFANGANSGINVLSTKNGYDYIAMLGVEKVTTVTTKEQLEPTA